MKIKSKLFFKPELKHCSAFARVQTPFSFAPSLRGWREKGAPTHTYPDQREQSWASIYTCLPLGSPVKWVWWSFYTRETDSGEEQHKQEGEMSKPFAFFYHSSQPNILYYNNDYSIHILNKKHADFLIFFFCLFLKKGKIKILL